MPDKLPALQFYPGDWRKDPGVQAVDLYCRGFWFECLMLMHESEERGVLAINGRPIPVENLARLLGETKKKTQKTIGILLEFGVAAKREDGAIFCRRMVRDEQIRAERAEAGRKGGKQNRSKTEAKPEAKPKQKAPPSSSVSISSSSAEEDKAPPDGPDQPNIPADSLERMAVENEFVAKWNSLKRGAGGVVPIASGAMPANLKSDFWAMRADPVMWSTAEKALEAIRQGKIRNGVRMALRKFLQPSTPDEIVGGLHDFSPNDDKRAAGFLTAEMGGGTPDIVYTDMSAVDDVLEPVTPERVKNEGRDLF